MMLLILGCLWFTAWSRVDATIYAHGFSESKFRRIEKGMSKAEVRRILGNPLTGNANGHIEGALDDENTWSYADLDCTKIPAGDDDRVTNTWYKIRDISFDKTGRMQKTVSSTKQFE
jgi:hypothetical protein